MCDLNLLWAAHTIIVLIAHTLNYKKCTPKYFRYVFVFNEGHETAKQLGAVDNWRLV